MPRRLRAFLSYRRLDAREASELERALGLRGISLWRDVSDLPLGGLTEREILRGIAASDGFVLYVTPRVFSSDMIWHVEVPAAIARARLERRGGRDYPIVPVLRGVSIDELKRQANLRRVRELPLRNAAFVPVDRGERATPARRRRAFAALGTRLLRSLLQLQRPGAVAITLRSFDPGVGLEPLLDLDWGTAIDEGAPRTWSDELIPAVRSLKSELGQSRHVAIDLFVQARLSAALLFGMIFPVASGFTLSVQDRQGAWQPRRRGRQLDKSERPGGHTRALLEVSLAQDAGRTARSFASDIGARHVTLVPPAGPSRTYDPRPHSGAIAYQVGDVAREFRRDGAHDLYLIFVGPAALAVLIGQHLRGVGRVHALYREREGRLREAYMILT